MSARTSSSEQPSSAEISGTERGAGRSTLEPYAEALTAGGDGAKIASTADYFVIPAPCPCSVALFSCPCGAKAVEYDLKEVAPPGWSTSDDGVLRCPECSARVSARETTSS